MIEPTTPERSAIYERAMIVGTADQLDALAAAFGAEDLPAHAEMLRRCAAQRRGGAREAQPSAEPAPAAPAAPTIDARLRGVQILLVEVVDAIRRLGGDSNGHAAATREITTGVKGSSCKVSTQFRYGQPFTVQADVGSQGVVAQLTVEWRLGGSIMQRTIDVAAGASISGFAESVTATLTDDTNTTTHPHAPASYVARVFIAPAARATTAVPPTLTGALSQSIAAGSTSGNIAVPQGANGVAVYGSTSAGTATLTLALFDDTEGTTTMASIGGASSLGFIPLPAGTSQVAITNAGASAAAVTVIFSIDG